VNNNNGKEVLKPTFISSISSLISAKLQKEVIELSKYFKKNTYFQQRKLYVNATSPPKQTNPSALKNITRERLKIKETFSNLPNKKIEEIQKVINSSNEKIKLKINITIRGLSRK